MSDLLHDNLKTAASHEASRIAFRCGTCELTYEELDAKSSQVATFLIENGVSRGACVGIRMLPSIESPIAVYGVLKAGAAFVPIDPLAPDQRLGQVLREGNIRVLLTLDVSDRTTAYLDEFCEGLELMVGRRSANSTQARHASWDTVFAGQRNHELAARVSADDPAYVIFTSGSTGRPKGIVHTHRSGQAYARLSTELYGVVPSDRIANISPLHFDMSTFGYLSSVYAAATTILVPAAVGKLPASLSQLIERERISIWYSVPFALVQLLERGVVEKRDCESLRWVLYGGEPLSAVTLNKLRAAWPGTAFGNVYGPAEVNQCTYFNIAALKSGGPGQLDADQPIPIGETWAETEAKIISENGELLEGEGSGELLIRSSTMMAHYWNGKPDDAEVFWTDSQGCRYYRTGDIVRRRSDENLVFVGRKDHQVKIRGYRVELEEVERAASGHQHVEECAAFCVDVGPSRQLVLAASSRADTMIDNECLLTHLASRLPQYAVPERVVMVDSFPRTTSGKIDRKALAKAAVSDGPDGHSKQFTNTNHPASVVESRRPVES